MADTHPPEPDPPDGATADEPIDPGTDDPWVVLTPMPRPADDDDNAPTASAQPPRRRALCPVCGAYWPCEHAP